MLSKIAHPLQELHCHFQNHTAGCQIHTTTQTLHRSSKFSPKHRARRVFSERRVYKHINQTHCNTHADGAALTSPAIIMTFSSAPPWQTNPWVLLSALRYEAGSFSTATQGGSSGFMRLSGCWALVLIYCLSSHASGPRYVSLLALRFRLQLPAAGWVC